MKASKRKVDYEFPVKNISGKTSKNVNGYFRFHYGEKRFVQTKPYEDNPTDNQLNSRAQFAELRRQVSLQLHDPVLGPAWRKKYEAEKKRLKDAFPYKIITGYVYAQLKAGNSPQ